MLGWHFVGKTLRDGRPIPANGEWLVHKGEIIPCVSGLHMSEHPFDALMYAPGNTLCRVELEDDIVNRNDKLIGRKRKIISRIDAERLLKVFAHQQILSTSHLRDTRRIAENYSYLSPHSFAQQVTMNSLWYLTCATSGYVTEDDSDSLWYNTLNTLTNKAMEEFKLLVDKEFSIN